MAGPAARPAVVARFPALAEGYESFYLRAVDPQRPRSVWLRHTVHRDPGRAPLGSVWVTLFDRDAPAPVAHKVTLPDPRPEPWLRVGDSAFGPDGVRGTAGPAAYDLRWAGDAPPLRHLPRELLYRTPLPRTKLESPRPDVDFDGTVTIGATGFALDGWPGMVGHNWGAEHAERWIWLHGAAFEGEPDAWLDLSIGRVKIGPVTTPWIANGALHHRGTRTRISGRAQVTEDPLGAEVRVGGLRLTATSPREHVVVWRYGHHHHTANCSVATLELTHGATALRTAHGGAYELGMREAPAGLPVQPFPDP